MPADNASPPPGLLSRIWRYPLVQMAVVGTVLLVAANGASVLTLAMRPPDNSAIETVCALLIAAALIVAYKACQHWIERRPDKEFELAGAARELALGLGAGFLLFCSVVAVVWLLGGIRFAGVRGTGELWGMLTMAIISGTLEETLFRGIILRQLEAILGTWIALGITAALFGAAHLANADATWFSALAIALEAGILLGAAYLLTRRLWLAIGLHAAWNFTQGWVFSVPVSGGNAPLGLFITSRTGPDWLTGGAFGIEASAVAVVVATLAGLAMLRRVIQRGGMRAPPWRA